ncbi:MAG: sulfate adenylyltransferase subunit CysD [Pseudomonadota bacterium]
MNLPTSNPPSGVWDTQAVHEASAGESLRTTERALKQVAWLPQPLSVDDIRDDQDRPLNGLVVEQQQEEARRKRQSSLVLQHVQGTPSLLMTNDGRSGRRWRFLEAALSLTTLVDELDVLLGGKDALIWPTADLIPMCRHLAQLHGGNTIELPSGTRVTLALVAYREPGVFLTDSNPGTRDLTQMSHLDRLEAQSIHIMREVVAQAENPVMLYSVGKDSSVMLHLARKAFYPSPPPFPLMHVDTRWKFQSMYEFRNYMADAVGMDLIVHINPEGVEKNINPFDHGSALHTDIMKTQGLKQALDQHRFDVAFGGARRDEEKSRAKERVFSFRNSSHGWDPKNQRPEVWDLYNGYKRPGESIRVFPLSNWTELDIWQYIYREQIPIVPLYFAAERPVVERDGMLLMVDDERMRMLPGERIQTRKVRFRTLGCYPLTGAIDSNADDLASIVLELLQSRTSERQGRAIDADSSSSMEKKKQEGYF